jgi:hypothetical protein
MIEKTLDMGEFILNELRKLPVGSTQNDVKTALQKAVRDWHAGEIVVQRNPDDPNRIDVLVPAYFFQRSDD